MDELLLKNITLIIGTIFTSIVAGFFTLMNLISSKEQKVSEFRQKWIDSLRDSVSNYISALSYISILYKHRSDLPKTEQKSKLEMTESVESVYAKLNESYNDIIFRVNHNETDKVKEKINREFLIELQKSRRLYMKGDYLNAFKTCNSIREKTRPLLKYEWQRVKNGEKSFIYAKRFSIALLVVGFLLSCFAVVLIFNDMHKVFSQQTQ